MPSLKEVLMIRDEMTAEEAEEVLQIMAERVMGEGEDPAEVLADEVGLEPDYVYNLLEYCR